MFRVNRPARGAVIALGLALVVAAPAAAATPPAPVPTPIRIVNNDLQGFTIPAGYACSFDVAGRPDWGFTARTTFPDGHTQGSIRAHGAYVNVATGAEYPTADNFRVLEYIDPVTNIDTVVISGQAASSYLPGDSGPFGIVTEASFYDIVGTFGFKYNLTTGVQTDTWWHGTVTDICAALS